MNARRWVRKLWALLWRQRADREFVEELEFHLERQVEENVALGMSPAEARRVARRDFGGVEQVREAHREARGVPWLETLWRDVRQGVRSLSRSPGLTAVAILSLALGIGVNTAIFSVANAVVLSPLPYPQPERLMRIWPEARVNTEFYVHFQQRTKAFEAVSIASPTLLALTGSGRPEELSGTRITPEHFAVMGVEPVLGRSFAVEETAPGKTDVVVLSYGLWQGLFGGREDAIGERWSLGGREHTVVGVMPADYQPLDSASRFWVPLEIDPTNEAHQDWITYELFGRLAPGITTAQGTDDLRRAIAAYVESRTGYFERRSRTANLLSLHEHLVGGYRNAFGLLAGGMLLVLLVACVNVVNLLLARVTRQRAELALRNALGAGAARLVSQVLTQSVVLALAGGAVGVVVARVSLSALVGLLPANMPRTADVRIDAAVLAFTLGLALLSGLLFGLPPALRASRVAPRSALSTGGRGGISHPHRLSHILIAAEVAVAASLVVGTGLLVKSFGKLQAVDKGFSAEHLITMHLKPPLTAYPGEEERRQYFRNVVERVRAVRGVESAAVINRLPMTPGDVGISEFHPADREMTPETSSVSVRLVSVDFLETFGIPLIRGRGLLESDKADSPAVGLINQAMARQLWGEDDPVGAQLVFDTGETWFTVVGVVRDIRQHRLDQETAPQAYRPIAQSAWENRMALAVRMDPNRPPAQGEIEQAIWSVDSTVPVVDTATMDELIRRTLKNPRMMTTLFSLFGLVALGLGLAGVFGVTAYAVGQRTRENGVRMAFGATSSDVVRSCLQRTMKPVLAGLVAGCGLSLLLTRFLEGFLFGVEPVDLTVFAGVAGLLTASAAAASYFPARRAAAVDPVVALRQE